MMRSLRGSKYVYMNEYDQVYGIYWMQSRPHMHAGWK